MIPFNYISIHGAPRSGTSWLGQIFDSSQNVKYKFQPLFSLTFKNRVNSKSSSSEIHQYLNELYNKKDDYLDANYQKSKGIYSDFNKNKELDYLVSKMVRYHYMAIKFLYTVSNVKIVFIIRNPCGVINSWSQASEKEFLPNWNLSEQWYFAQGKNEFKPEEYYGFHRWKELAKMALYLKNNFPSSVYIVQYETLNKSPHKVINDLFSFCGIRFSTQTEVFLNSSLSEYNPDYYSVFKSNKNVHSWKDELSNDIIDKVYNELNGTELDIFLK